MQDLRMLLTSPPLAPLQSSKIRLQFSETGNYFLVKRITMGTAQNYWFSHMWLHVWCVSAQGFVLALVNLHMHPSHKLRSLHSEIHMNQCRGAAPLYISQDTQTHTKLWHTYSPKKQTSGYIIHAAWLVRWDCVCNTCCSSYISPFKNVKHMLSITQYRESNSFTIHSFSVYSWRLYIRIYVFNYY